MVMGKILTYKAIKEHIEVKSKSGCKLITTNDDFEEQKKLGIVASHVMLSIECECGNEFDSNFYNFKYNNKNGCRECGKKSAGVKNGFTFEQIKKYIDKYDCKLLTTLDEFNKSNKTKGSSDIELRIQCNCRNINTTTFRNFKNSKYKCKACVTEKIKKDRSFTYSTLKEDIESVGCKLLTNEDEFNHRIKLTGLSPSLVKLTILCNECKTNTYERAYGTFMRPSHRCAECGTKSSSLQRRKSHEEYNNQLIKKFGINEYTLLEKYEHGDECLLTRHNSYKCNNYEWYITPNNLLNSAGCPVCRETKGELAIRNTLTDKAISFIAQYEFNDLKSDLNVPLKFDFAVFTGENKLLFLIEYDGKQHFEHIASWMTKEKYERMKIHDAMKNAYCKQNDIPLLRIPYWEFENIETIVINKLIDYNLF
jgi:hypothetical protein